jgi:hypothetical protein
MIVLTAILVALATISAPAGGEHRLAVIVGRTDALSDISRDDLRLIYLGGLTRLGGRRISPVVLEARQPAQRYFLKNVVGMGEIDFTQAWIGAVFNGEVAGPPHLAHTPAEACRYVATHRNTIAFIDAAEMEGDVKAIKVDGKAPDAPDYPLVWK